jgi:eukaryotic-like serine/threonine-protein kinase
VGIALGQIIDGKYRVVRVIGAGGMGTVYEGENVRIGRKVAIKILNAAASGTADVRRRFEREAQVAAKIGSPYICDVIDLGDLPEGQCYLVMEYLEGQGLDSILESTGRMPPGEVAAIAVQLLEGLQAMHDAGIVHRDLKPANVFIARTTSGGKTRELVKILDFGISKFQSTEAVSLTQTGALLGTPLYMSPEQARGDKDVDARSDLYAVGVCLYLALSGKLPFGGTNVRQLLFQVALEAAPPLRGLVPDLDDEFASIVERAMSKTPEARFASAREFQAAVASWSEAHGQGGLALEIANTPIVSSKRFGAATGSGVASQTPLSRPGGPGGPSTGPERGAPPVASISPKATTRDPALVGAFDTPLSVGRPMTPEKTMRWDDSSGDGSAPAVSRLEPEPTPAAEPAPAPKGTPWGPIGAGAAVLAVLIAAFAYRSANTPANTPNAATTAAPSAPASVSERPALAASVVPAASAVPGLASAGVDPAPSAIVAAAPLVKLQSAQPGPTPGPPPSVLPAAPVAAPSASSKGRKIRTDI